VELAMDIERHVDEDGDVWWRLPHGQLHREDGPAVEFASGTQMWIKHGKQHREDGPAVVYHSSAREWYLNDKEYTFAEWLDLVAETPEQRTLLLLKWS